MAIKKNKKTGSLTAYIKLENTNYRKSVKSHEEGKKWIEAKRKELNTSK